jgi:hypothetical protein
MARTRLPDPARVPIGLEVSDADAARIDQVLARPEFAGWSRADWCREIIRTALRYYVGDAPGTGRERASARPAVPQPASPSPPPAPEPRAEPEPPAQPECSHPPDARDYQTGACAACGAILWD